MNLATPRRSSRVRQFVVDSGRDRRAIPVLGVVSVGDYFLPALPTQMSVMALGVLQPRRALWIVLTFAAASALGAALLAALVTTAGSYAAQFETGTFREAWASVAHDIQRHGPWVVLILSMLPTPPRVAVAANVLAGAAAPIVVGAVFLGKLVWFGTVLAVVVRSPQLIGRIPEIGPRLHAQLVQLRSTTDVAL